MVLGKLGERIGDRDFMPISDLRGSTFVFWLLWLLPTLFWELGTPQHCNSVYKTSHPQCTMVLVNLSEVKFLQGD